MAIEYPNTINLAKENAPEELRADVVIVGSGAGGGIAAEILTRSGLDVLIIEEGPLRTSQDFKMREKEAYADLYQEVASRQTLDKAIQILQGRCVGGSTTVNWTSSFRTPKETLDFWQSEFAIQGFSREQLDPWFEWAEQRLGIAKWSMPPNANNQKLIDGLSNLGLSHEVIPRNVKGCANLGYCGMGCPLNAKQSMLVSCIPAALQGGARLFSRARVETIKVQQGEVSEIYLTAMDRFGQVDQKNVSRVKATHFILSAGAIGTPALLMRSGLQQQIPQVGSRTFLHPVTAVIGEMAEAINGFSGAPQSIYSDAFLWRDGVAGEIGYKLEVPPLHPVISSTMLRAHGQSHFEFMQKFANYHASLALLRDGFHPQSIGGQVTLDQHGFPRLDYQINDVTWRALKDAMLDLTEIQFAAGAEKVYPLHMDAKFYTNWKEASSAIKQLPQENRRWQVMSAHVMGGCRIGTSPENGVVDQSGQVFGFKNLAIMDGSLFPTSLGVNPQLSIYGIVAKLASELVLKLGGSLPEVLDQRHTGENQ